MLSKRLIACLDVRDGCVVKGVNFEGLREAGDPATLARRYNAEGIDELVILDVSATIEGRRALERTLREQAATNWCSGQRAPTVGFWRRRCSSSAAGGRSTARTSTPTR